MILSVFMLSFANALSKCNETEYKKNVFDNEREELMDCRGGEDGLQLALLRSASGYSL